MTTKWSHLPNAAHVDAVIASLKANPEEWNAAYDAAWGAAWYAARNAVGGTILALIAFDDCAHLLDSEPDELRVLSKLGVDAATLMIPAATAFKLIREKQLAVL